MISNVKRSVVLAGNPNVGKSTVFNALTGMKQHTGNWSGKTVGCAEGFFEYKNIEYKLTDLPGCYSLYASVGEERAASEFLLYGDSDMAVTVCDATCLERNLILALQVCELHPISAVCVNLMDEASKKEISIDLERLSLELGVPVVGMSARSGNGIAELKEALCKTTKSERIAVSYSEKIEALVKRLSLYIESCANGIKLSLRGLSLGVIRRDTNILKFLAEQGCDFKSNIQGLRLLNEAHEHSHEVFLSVIKRAEEIAFSCTKITKESESVKRMRRADKILTGKYTALPLMALFFCAILWLTVVGANYPSNFLSEKLFLLQDIMYSGMLDVGVPEWICDALVLGVYRVLAWVVSVMLPPMAIFFPLFTLLEDLGYLPRIAFNLDRTFSRCHACGKQALTMCMGMGCNAVGVTGCRIISSKRERNIAILTNVFVPCNGRFPTLITLITLFFTVGSGVFGGALSAFMLFGVIALGVLLTFLVSFILSKTVCRGDEEAFILELPSYRAPQVGKVIIRSAFDRTLFVLGRAVTVAAPAGLIIWLFGFIKVGDISLLNYACGILDPFAKLFGLDGVILFSFVLGFPANEIVVPIMVMAYSQAASVVELEGGALLELLTQNGWDVTRALCVAVFCLCHFPCSTTLITIYKETKSKKLTFLSAIIPTVVGLAICFMINLFSPQ